MIRNYDTETAFHYLAPPYINCNMGHYGKMFSEETLLQLLDLLTTIEGKFMLTRYPNDHIRRYADQNGWHIHAIKRDVSAAKINRRKQEEWMIVNYKMDEK